MHSSRTGNTFDDLKMIRTSLDTNNQRTLLWQGTQNGTRLHSRSSDSQLDPNTTVVFFRSLFQVRELTEDVQTHRSALLAVSPSQISPTVRASITQPFHVDEFASVINKSKASRSSPGVNGLPHVFWASNTLTVAKVMCRLENALRSGRSMPALQPVAAGTVLFKHRGSPSDPSKYRPISVVDSDFRILDTVLQRRLLLAVTEITPESQTRFVAGRSIFQSSLSVHVVVSLVNLNLLSQPSVLLIDQDQQKAFDQVDRDWVWQVLRAKKQLATGDLFLLVELDMSVKLGNPFNGANAAYHPHDVAQQIPGHV